MAASPYRSTCSINGQQFNCLSTSVAFSTGKDRSGMPQMGSLATTIRVYADFHDDTNMPFSTMSTLFSLSNVVTNQKVVPIKLTFWKDDSHQDALAAYSFNGWISGFHTLNPYQSDEQLAGEDHTGVNHVLVLDLEASMNQQNFIDIALTN